MVDYSLRAGYLLSLAGGNISELSRMTGMSRRNLRRVMSGRQTADPDSVRYEPTTKAKRQINLQWNRRASALAKRQEAIPRGPKRDQHRVQPKLLNEADAKRLAGAFERMNIPFGVNARIAVVYIMEIEQGVFTDREEETLYSAGSAHPTVDAAKDSLTEVFERWQAGDLEKGSPEKIILDPPEPYEDAYRYRVWRPMRDSENGGGGA